MYTTGGQPALHSDTVRSRLPQNLMAYDPPPPYPGLPNNPHSTLSTQSFGQPKPELRHSVTNEVLYAFNRYGQMVPAHQVATVTSRPSVRINHGSGNDGS